MILVDVYIPAVDDSFDFMLDENAKVKSIVPEICEMLTKKMKDKDVSENDSFFIYLIDEKKKLENDKTLFESGVRDGSRLLLV